MKLRKKLYLIYRLKHIVYMPLNYIIWIFLFGALPFFIVLGCISKLKEWVEARLLSCMDKADSLELKHYSKFYRVFNRNEMHDREFSLTKYGKSKKRKALKRGY